MIGKRVYKKFTKLIVFMLLTLNIFSNDGKYMKKTATKKISPIFEDSGGNGIISGKQAAIKKQSTTFNYGDNNIYEIFSRPDFVTVIKLAPNEEVIDLVSGDTDNWNFSLKKGTNNRTMVYIMATDSDLKTNLFIPTNKRTYHFNIESGDIYNAIVEFQYPNERQMFVENFERENEILSTDIEKLNTSYSITNRNFNFSPTAVYDDGERTYIIFKNDLREMPTVLIRGEDGKSTLTLPNAKNKRMILDRTTEKIELILGKKKVVITNLKKNK